MADGNDNVEPTITITSLVDLAAAAGHDGPAWSQSSDDLNVNLIVLRAGHSIADHINREVDVLFMGVDGSGIVTIDGQQMALAAGELVIIQKGSRRSITPLGDRFAYLTCHRRRAGLWPTQRS